MGKFVDHPAFLIQYVMNACTCKIMTDVAMSMYVGLIFFGKLQMSFLPNYSTTMPTAERWKWSVLLQTKMWLPQPPKHSFFGYVQYFVHTSSLGRSNFQPTLPFSLASSMFCYHFSVVGTMFILHFLSV